MTSSMIFYTGIGLTAAAVIGLCAGLAAIKIRTLKLGMKLDKEYGKEERKENR